MENLKHKFEDFDITKYPQLNGTGTTPLTLTEISNYSIFITNATFSQKPLSEIIWRMNMMQSSLCIATINNKDMWVRSPNFNNLDPSEKGGVSFYIGMTFTAALAAKTLKFKSLVHLDSLLTFWSKLPRNKFNYKIGDKRPDLVGYKKISSNVKNNQKIVRGFFESKGRSNGFDSKAEKKSMSDQLQKKMGPSSAGKVLKVAAQTFVSGSLNFINVKFRDPLEDDWTKKIRDIDFATSIETIKIIECINIIQNKGTAPIDTHDGYICYYEKEIRASFKINKKAYELTKTLLEETSREQRYSIYEEIREITELNIFNNDLELVEVQFDEEINSEVYRLNYTNTDGTCDFVRYIDNNDLVEDLRRNLKNFVENFYNRFFADSKNDSFKKTGFFREDSQPNTWSILINGTNIGSVEFDNTVSRVIMNLKIRLGDAEYHDKLQRFIYQHPKLFNENDFKDLHSRETIHIDLAQIEENETDSSNIGFLIEFVYNNY